VTQDGSSLGRLDLSRPSRSVEVAQSLLSFLLSGELRPGERIPGERSLSQTLGVGRSALREALTSLTLLGLLEVRPGDGTYLSSTNSSLLPQIVEWGILLGERHIEDLVEARQEIEVSLAGLAARRRTEDDIAVLSDALRAMHDSVHDREAYIEADVEFHLVVATVSRNTVLSGVLANIRSLLRVWTMRVVTDPASSRDSLALHPPIFEAIRDGDAEAARSAMAYHMERAAVRLRDTMPD
jgi:GntR family transcriptional regulator, transcriptional repressor for pyruvate dehydrogenase complex